MSIALALGAAMVYGAADFIGGVASRRAPVLAVVFWSQVAGMALLGGFLLLFPGPGWTGADLGFGLLAGGFGAAANLLFYRALATGRMSVVAPVNAVVSAAVPVLAGLVMGERPGLVAGVGLGLALVGIVLLGCHRQPAPGGGRRLAPFGLALGAGLLFGGFSVALSRTGGDSGMLPLLAARAVSIVITGSIATAARVAGRIGVRDLPLLIGFGLLDTLGGLLYLAAIHHGLLSLVAVLTAIYPAGTVGLAFLLLGERLRWPQWAGLGAVLGAAALISTA